MSSLTLTDDLGLTVKLTGDDIQGGLGNVLQVVNYVSVIETSQSTSTVDLIVSDISKTITPRGNNSTFLVGVRWFGEVVEAWQITFNIHMNGIRVNNIDLPYYGLAAPQTSYWGNDNSSTPNTANFKTLVTSSSVIGTPITFDFVVSSYTAWAIWTNRCIGSTGTNYERGTSEIIITEIGT